MVNEKQFRESIKQYIKSILAEDWYDPIDDKSSEHPLIDDKYVFLDANEDVIHSDTEVFTPEEKEELNKSLNGHVEFIHNNEIGEMKVNDCVSLFYKYKNKFYNKHINYKENRVSVEAYNTIRDIYEGNADIVFDSKDSEFDPNDDISTSDYFADKKELHGEYKMTQEQKLRESIRKQILDLISEAKGETMSGMKKVKETHKQTAPAKGVKAPKTTKVTKDSPPASVTATKETKAEPTGVEVKKMKDSDKDKPKKEDGSFEIEIDGIEYKVKGPSNAESSYTLLIGQIQKALEGKGKYVKKINIEMGDKKDVVEESVRSLVREELKKFLFS